MDYKTIRLSFLGSLDGKESICNERDLDSIPELGRSPGGGHGNPLQYSCLENPHGQRSLAGYSSRSHKESDWMDKLSTAQHSMILEPNRKEEDSFLSCEGLS